MITQKLNSLELKKKNSSKQMSVINQYENA
jgi:hypothetical protein